jgi:small subunit ribosomal protein S1
MVIYCCFAGIVWGPSNCSIWQFILFFEIGTNCGRAIARNRELRDTIELAAHAGFCFGVKRAVEFAEQNAPNVTLGAIINNRQAVSALEKAGVVAVQSLEDLPPDGRVVIRAHGVGRRETEALDGRAVIDATCPYVKRIHQMARRAAEENRPLIVIGKRSHPEVMGVLGWAGPEAWAVNEKADVEALPPGLKKPLVVTQATITKAMFEEISGVLIKRYPDAEVKRTICAATVHRQEEAVALAKRSDVMVVIGSPESANSRKLYELARAICPRTYFIETAAEVNQIALKPGDAIGITAGASTPDCIIKEVVTAMNDIEKQVTQSEELHTGEAEASTTESDFMADVEKTLVQIRPGQTIVGTVVQITDDEVCVNVGYKADGLVKKADLSSTDVKIGDEIEVEVVKVNDGEGNVVLSQRNIVNKKNWDEIVAKHEAGEFVEGVGKEAVKGGLLADVLTVRTFIPASQLSMRYVEKISEFVGQEMTLKIIEIDKAKRRIVASRKAVLIAEEAKRKEAIWEELKAKEGEIVEGTVRRLADFGAFVDIGGVDGLVHVTDLSWGRVHHPSEVVNPGDVIQVKILKVEPERERVSLSYKQTRPRPWTVAGEKYPVGSVVEGKVVRITTFGAFVELEPGLDGLVHISQCALTRIARVEDAVNVGEIVRVKVLDVNTEAKRISLSIREVLEDEALYDMPTHDEYAIAADDTLEPGMYGEETYEQAAEPETYEE